MSSIEDTDARFAVAQAVYSELGAQLKTGGAGELRAAEDEAVMGLYAQTGGKVRDIRLNGAKVGEIRVETKDGFTVTDAAAYAAWCAEHGAYDGFEEIDWTRLGPEDAYAARELLRERYPQMFVETHTPATPSGDWLTFCDGDVFDVETGEQVPGVEFRTSAVKTVVRGCKWGGVPRKGGPGWQFTPVRDAVRGLPPAEVVGMITGGE